MEVGISDPGEGLISVMHEILERHIGDGELHLQFEWAGPAVSNAPEGARQFVKFTLEVAGAWLLHYDDVGARLELNRTHAAFAELEAGFNRNGLDLRKDLQYSDTVAAFDFEMEGVESWNAYGERMFSWREDRARPVLRYLAFLMNAPLIMLRRRFENFVRVPPLRQIPGDGPQGEDDEFELHGEHPEEERRWPLWKQLAWRLDGQWPGTDFINRALLEPELLDIGYEVTAQTRYLLTDAQISALRTVPDAELKDRLRQSARKVKLFLRDVRAERHVSFADVGVGVSQVVPVLLAATEDKAYIEQPELHLHPRAQAALGDVFLEAVLASTIGSSTRYLLLETHSELLLLRILKRIRQAAAGQAREGLEAVSRDLVSVVYVNRDRHGHARIHPLRISRAGEFLDRWPDGFFAERDGELFDDE